MVFKICTVDLKEHSAFRMERIQLWVLLHVPFLDSYFGFLLFLKNLRVKNGKKSDKFVLHCLVWPDLQRYSGDLWFWWLSSPHHHFSLITPSLMSSLGACLPALPGGKEHSHQSTQNAPYQSRGPMDSSHYRTNGTFQCYQQKSQIHHNYDRFVYEMDCYLTPAWHFGSWNC